MKKKQSRTEKKNRIWIYFSLFLLFDFILNFVWMIKVPMSEAPDEINRIILSDYIYQHGSLPNAWNEEVRILGWGFSYAMRPMLVNIIGGWNMRLVSLFTTNVVARVMAARIVSVFSATVMTFYCFKIGLALNWKKGWIWMLACLSALTPQITFLASYNNNDIFSLACTTALIYYWIKGAKNNWRWRDCIWFSIAMGLTILSYYNAYSYILFSIPVFFLTAFHRNMSKEEKKTVWKKTAFIVLLTFLIAGWWFIRNIILYDGDVLGSGLREIMGEKYAIEELKPENIFRPIREGISYLQVLTYNIGDYPWYLKTAMSTIGVLGPMNFYFESLFYNIPMYTFIAGCVLCLVQWVTWFVQAIIARFKDRELNHKLIIGLFIFASALLTCALALYYSWTDDYQPQGRYIMPAFTSFILFMVTGYRFGFELVGKIFRSEKFETILSWIVSAVFCAGICFMQVHAMHLYFAHTASLPYILKDYKIRLTQNDPSFDMEEHPEENLRDLLAELQNQNYK